MVPYVKHMLEGIQKGLEITGDILAFDRDSLQNCFLTVLVLPTARSGNLIALQRVS